MVERKTKVTKIEKKYTDKKTGETKSITIDYAKVADRLKEFRQDFPDSKITNKCHTTNDGSIIFKAYVWKDKTEFIELLKSGVSGADALESADSEGSVRADAQKLKDEKGYEKQETIAVGRALALLGYAASGEIASYEEMEEFNAYKAEKHAEEIEDAIEALQGASTVEELKQIFLALPIKVRAEKLVVAEKDKAKQKLAEKGVKNVAENGK